MRGWGESMTEQREEIHDSRMSLRTHTPRLTTERNTDSYTEQHKGRRASRLAGLKGLRFWFWAFFLGMLLCLNDRLQPFRLKSMELDGFSSDLELTLRDWSEPFLVFHPVWLLARQELRNLECLYPLTIKAKWSPFYGRLNLTAVPFAPALRLIWHHTEYMASQDGVVWPTESWSRALNIEIPEVPCLNVASSFPLLEDSGTNSSTHLKVPLQWLLYVLRAPEALGEMKVSSLELLRRGGEDLLKCDIKNESNGNQISFLGRTSGLEKSLLVVRELMSGRMTDISSVDATYEDKIIIKKTPQAQDATER